MNQQAFAWGRLAVVDPQAVQQAAGLVRNRHTDTESTRARCIRCRQASGRATNGAPLRRRATPATNANCAACPRTVAMLRSCRWTTPACRARWMK